MLDDAERCNCPWCGGSGHVDDCDEADRAVKAKLTKAEADRAALVEALREIRAEFEECDECRCEEALAIARAALTRVKGADNG